MEATEFGEDGSQQPWRFAGHAHFQRTTQFALYRTKLFLRREQSIEQGLGAFVEQSTGFRHTQVAGASLQQAHAESALQRSDMAADVGRGDGQQTRCASKALLINNCRVDTDRIQIESIAH
ncbi:hypothetical protein OR16_04562 [Cupriavidus basilensis OR16]|uniref:Uncharacterized protein n=1 Tax=Cupriavidus basilensis OR16 TaxID=1127483 RepID=H1S004_9BURK|nr:hypothetical protein OR16_04562 [Cupriavidus basilensis OR16]MBB1635848.1 hypothetical protein [Cupriavidus sp. UME77]